VSSGAARLPVAVLGAAGRMGERLCALIGESADLTLAGALVRPGSALAGRPLGAQEGPVATDRIEAALAAARVAIDFTPAGATLAHARACSEAGVALLVGTTGLGAAEQAAIEVAARCIPVLCAANTSLGVHVLAELVRRAAELLPADFDIEILDIHHRAKRDAPSGTAYLLGEAAAAGRGVTHDGAAVTGRTGLAGPREAGSIGYAALRGGDVVGEHSVYFAGTGERLTLSHAATDRTVFAAGALRAARFLARQGPGLYTMADVIRG
jgi:4-hydroxy-tetrahydrodipicolinate reductase